MEGQQSVAMKHSHDLDWLLHDAQIAGNELTMPLQESNNNVSATVLDSPAHSAGGHQKKSSRSSQSSSSAAQPLACITTSSAKSQATSGR